MSSEYADPDIELMLRFQKGDEPAFEELVKKHTRGVLNLVYRYLGDASRAEDSFAVPLDNLQRFEVDYLAKTLRVSLRGGRTYNFTTREQNADALLAFQKKVEEVRRRLAAE